MLVPTVSRMNRSRSRRSRDRFDGPARLADFAKSRLQVESLEARLLLSLSADLTCSDTTEFVLSRDEIRQQEIHRIDNESFEFVWEPTAESDFAAQFDGQFDAVTSPSTLGGLFSPLTSVPAFHSLAGAAATLFLDFDGHFEPVWGAYTNVSTPAYDIDGDLASFSETELLNIGSIWARVAEDFAPFNIDVTTVEPAVLAEGTPINQANGVALRVAMGGSYTNWFGNPAGGVGYVDSFTSSIANTVYVFTGGGGIGDPRWAGTVASHEAGHGFGLQHQSVYDAGGTKLEEYNPGNSSWAPIMGNAQYWSSNVATTWHNGPNSTGPNVFQDDMAVLARSQNGFGHRSDDHGDSSGSSTALTFDGVYWSGAGIVETNSDVDVFRVSPTAGGSHSFRVDVDSVGPNLDVVLELRDSTGVVLATADPANDKGAEVMGNLAAGEDYYLHVTKIDTYGCVGQYTVSGFAVAPGPYVTSTDPAGTSSMSELSTIRVIFAAPVNADTFDASDVTLSGPLGSIGVTGVAVISGSSDKEFDVTIDPQTAYGTYSLAIGPDVFDPAVNPMNQDQDESSGEAIEDQFATTIYLGEPSISIDDVQIIEGDSGSSQIEFTVTRSGDPSVAFTVNYYTVNDTATDATLPHFSQRAIVDTADGAWSVLAADVDSDGDDDILVASFADDTIAWYENDGNGNFTGHTITTTADLARSVFAADVDGDGDMDVLSASANDDTIAWYENDGNQNFTTHVITALADYAESVFAADIDGDGDIDVLSASLNDDTVAWYENDGNENFAVHVISNTADGVRSVFAADMDGDGDLDVLSASGTDDTIAWYENDGAQNFVAHIISDTADLAWSVFAADVDGDGDADVLSGSQSDDTIAWYENDGNGNFSEHVITDFANGARSVFTADVDGDGDTDILAASGFDDTVAWYENDGNEHFAVHVITTQADLVTSVFAADLDGDGAMDILSASALDDTVAWFKNEDFLAEAADYQSASGTLTFAAGETDKTISVTVNGDAELEDDEIFYVTLHNAGVAIADHQGTGTILNDDQPIVLFTDSFENGQWNGLWVEDSQNDWFTSTQRATAGSYSAEVDGRATNATLTMSTPVDLSGYASAELAFDWLIESGFDSGEYLAMDVFDGLSWVNDVRRLNGNSDTENTWHAETVDLTPYLSASTRIRFRAYVSGSSEDANVDNVQITASGAALPNNPPTADAGGPYFADEGSSVMVDASGSFDTDGTIASYEWDLDGDGQYDDATGATASFVSTEDGLYTVTVRVTDNRGDSTADAAVVTVGNVAPTASAGGPYAGVVGGDVILDAVGSTDPGSDIASYEWDLDGDGDYDDATGVTAVFNSVTPASYAVSVRVTDDDGASSIDSTTVQITDVPSEVVVFADSFENGQWNGLWVEDSQNDWFTSTQRATEGNYSAEVDGRATNATLTLSSPVDLSSYASAQLTFDWLIESGFDRGEYLSLDVFNGSSWVNGVRSLNGNSSSENVWHGESVDLSPYMSSSTLIRFRAYVSGSSEDANVDNIRIVASSAAGAPMNWDINPTSAAQVGVSADQLALGNPHLLDDVTLDGCVDGQHFVAWNADKFDSADATAASGQPISAATLRWVSLADLQQEDRLHWLELNGHVSMIDAVFATI